MYPIDLESINYEAVWDSLGLKERDRVVANKVIEAYQTDPDLRNSILLSRGELNKIACRAYQGLERRLIPAKPIFTKRLKLKIKRPDIILPRTLAIDTMIDAGILEKNNGDESGYKLNPHVLQRLERKY